MRILFFFLIIIFTLSKLVIAEEKSPPKVTTQQYDNWTYQCIESGKNKNCEVSQTIRIQNTNINFSVTYTNFLDEKKNKVQLITIISPLGIDLKKKLSQRFDDKEEVSSADIRKELFEGGNVERGGAVKDAIERGLLNENSSDTALNNVNISISDKNDDDENTEN